MGTICHQGKFSTVIFTALVQIYFWSALYALFAFRTTGSRTKYHSWH